MFSVYLTCGYRTERYIVDKKENSNNEQTIYMDNGHRTTFMCSPFYETNLRNQDEFYGSPLNPRASPVAWSQLRPHQVKNQVKRTWI